MKVPTIEPLEARIAPAVLTIVPVDSIKDEGSISNSTTSFKFKVILDQAEPQDVSVVATIADGTAKLADGDFTAFSQTITIPKGATEFEFTVPIKQDTLVEADETFSVVLSSPSPNAAIAGDGKATATIRTDDLPKISIVADGSSTVQEGSAPNGTTNLNFLIKLTEASATDVTVVVSTKDGTAKVADGDYDAFSQTITIPAGQTQVPVSIPIKHDALDESNETLTVELSSPSSNAIISQGTITGTIQDDDPPFIRVESLGVVTEGGIGGTQKLRFRVFLNTEASEEVSFEWLTNNAAGSASAGIDFTTIAPTLVTIAAGQKETIVEVPIIGDDIVEQDETVQVTIRNAKLGQNALSIQNASATGTIQNDDVTVSVNGPATVTEGGEAVFNITRHGATGFAVEVEFEFVDLQNNTARLNFDYGQPTSMKVTIPASAFDTATGTFRVPITVDDIFEHDEVFKVKVKSVKNAALTGDEQFTTAILNDDAAPTLQFSQTTVLELTEGNPDANGNQDQQFTVTVNLSKAAEREISFDWAAVNGTAIAGLDFAGVTAQTVTIAPGQTTATLVLVKKGDKVHETSLLVDGETSRRGEHFSLVLSNAVNATINPNGDERTVRLLDDDAAPILAIEDAEVFEGDGTNPRLGFKVKIANGVTADQDIQFSWVAGLGSATPGVDYDVVTGSPATIAAGQSEVTLFLNINDDAVNEIDETVLASIGTALLNGQTNLSVSDNQATGRILNDDLPLTLTALESTVVEGAAETTRITKYRVSIPSPSAHDVSVTIEFDDDNSTADLGADFTLPANATVIIPAGQTFVDFDVTIKGESVFETDETLTLKLANPVHAQIGTGSATLTIVNDDDVPTLSIVDASVEEGDSGNKVMEFTVKLSNPAGEDITFDWSTIDGAAIGGIDFSKVINRQGKILKGQSEAKIVVALSGDTTDEPDENFQVVVSNAMLGGTPIQITDGTATGTIENDDITARISGAFVTEGNAGDTPKLRFVVTLSEASDHAVTVTFKIGENDNDTAEAGVDYVIPSDLTVTIPAGQMSATFDVDILTDDLDEVNETLTVELTDAVGAELAATAATGRVATGTILDDDAAPTLSIIGVTMAEGSSGTTNFIFKIKRTGASGQDIQVRASTIAGTALAGSDFTARNEIVTIPADDADGEVEFVVVVNGDLAHENNEAFTVALTNATGATIEANAGTATGTITNDDAQPTLTIGDASLAENGGTMTFTVTLGAASGLPVTFTLSTADGSAKAGKDYTQKTQNFTIQPGQTTATFTVPITNDSLYELEETFKVNVSNVGGATVNTPSATGTINRVPGAQDPTVTVNDITVIEGNSGEKEVEVTVSLSQAAGYDLEFDWNLVANPSAEQGVDFALHPDWQPGTVTIPAGETSVKLKFKVFGDTENELDEAFSVALSNAKLLVPDADHPGEPDIDLGFTNNKSTAEVKILNDERFLTIADVTELESNGDKVFRFKVTLSSASAHSVVVNWTTQDGTASSSDVGSKLKDFIAASGPAITFAPGQTEKFIDITVKGDTQFDGTDQFKVLLTSATNAQILDGEATGTITDDDARPTISFVNNGVTVVEGGDGDEPQATTQMEFKVKLSHASDETVEVSFSTANGSAVAGSDFTGITNQRVTFAPGELEKSVFVTIQNDSIFELDQSFTAALSDPLRGVLATEDTGDADGSPKATGTITPDDDAAPALKITGQSVLEGNAGERYISFTISKTGATDETSTFQLATVNGTATADDFFAKNETITMAPGETSKTVLVRIKPDATIEGDETFEVQLSNLEHARLADAADGKATGTLLNDDLTVSLDQGTVEVLEGNSGQSDLVFKVKLSAAATHPVEVTYSIAAGSATSGTDFAPPTVLTIVIPAGLTEGEIRIPINGDTTAEAAETLSVTLTGAKNAVLGTTNLSKTGTIVNDDAGISIANVTKIEGSAGTSVMRFVVRLDAPSTFPVTVNYATSNNTATSGSDYTAVNGTLTFNAGETEQFIDVPILGDTTVEGDETFTINLSNANGAALITSQATGTIQDDESLLTIDDVSIEEGNSGTRTITFTVTRSPGSSTPATVRVSTADGTATSTGALPDFISKSEVLTFAANETTKTFSVVVNSDLAYEISDETFRAVLSEATGAVILDGEGTGTIKAGGDTEPTLSIADASVVEGHEGSKLMKFVVSLSQPSDTPVKFNFRTVLGAGGTAANAIDFTEFATQEFTIQPGSTTLEIEVPIHGDGTVEASETFTAEISNATIVPPGGGAPAAVTIADGSGIGTIVNDDLIVSVVSTATVIEGQPGVNLTLSLKDLNGAATSAPAGGVTVTFQLANGTAILGTDFAGADTFTVTILEGESQGTITIPISPAGDPHNDTIYEGDETFTVTLTGATSAQLGDTVSTVTIQDDEAAPIITVDPVSVDENPLTGNGSRNAVFTVKLDKASSKDTTIKWVTSFVADGAGPSDFTHQGVVQTLVIPAGQTTGTISIAITNDSEAELDEAFDLQLVEANGATLPADKTITGTILKNDLSVFSISPATVVEGASGTTTKLVFTVSRAGGLNLPAQVNFTTLDGIAKGGGDATFDYLSDNGTLMFAAGEASKTIEITVNGDSEAELDETLNVTLTNPVNATLGSQAFAFGKILNDEVTYRLAAFNASGVEVPFPTTIAEMTGNSTLTFHVIREGLTSVPGTIFYSVGTNSGSGAIQATAGQDFIAKSSTVSFAANETKSTAIDITILNDALYEANETFLIKLSTPVNGQIASGEGEKVITITDDDNTPANLPKVLIDDATIVEGANGTTKELVFKVRLVDRANEAVAKGAGGQITVTYSTADGPAGPTGAIDPSDYTEVLGGTVVFAAGETEKEVRISIIGDNFVEGDETFTVKLDGAVLRLQGTTEDEPVPQTNDTAAGKIVNDDTTITLDPVSQFTEGGNLNGKIRIKARIAEASPVPVTFKVSTIDGTAVAVGSGGDDYTGLSGFLVTFAPGETEKDIEITVNDDLFAEGNETFTLQLSDATNAQLGTTTQTITILNDDAAPSISIGDASIVEGDSGQLNLVFTVSLSGAIRETVTFDYATEDGTAKSSGALIDYLARSSSLSFTPGGATTQTIEIPINGDMWRELSETFSVKLSDARLGGSTEGITIADGEATGTIEDNGDTTLGVIVHSQRSTESSAMKFVIETTAPVTGSDVSLIANTRFGTAEAGADFTQLTNSPITIAVGQSSTEVTVTIANDSVFEAAEHFFLDVTGFGETVKAVNGSATVATAFGVILNDDIKKVSDREYQFSDADGDLVTVKFSKGTIRIGQELRLTAGTGALGGYTIDTIDMASALFGFEGVNISVTSKPQILITGEVLGDAKTNVGTLSAAVLGGDPFEITSGVALGSIKISGNLNTILAGSTKRPLAAQSIEVGSFGSDSTSGSLLLGPVGKFVVNGDFMGSLQVVGDVAGQPFPGMGIGRIGTLIIKGALKGGTNDGSGQISYTAGIGSATIGSIQGGAGDISGALLSKGGSFNTRIGKLTVLGDIAGGTGENSGVVEARQIGGVTLGKAGANGIEGDLVGGSGKGSGRIISNRFGSVVINGSVIGGGGEDSGVLRANEALTSTRITGDIQGGGGKYAGRVEAVTSLGNVTIEGNIEGGGGERSGTLIALGVRQVASGGDVYDPDNVQFGAGTANSVTIGKSGNGKGSIIGGTGAESGRVEINGNLAKLTAHGNLEGGKGAGSGSIAVSTAKSSSNLGRLVAPAIAKSITIKGDLLGGDTDVVGTPNAVTSLLGSGFIEADTIGAITIEGDIQSGVNNGTALAKSGSIHSASTIASLRVMGDVIGNSKVPVIISALQSIGNATFDKGVTYAEILAGYSAPTAANTPRGVLQNAGASINSVTVKGAFTASSIVAGVHAGTDGFFGTLDDTDESNGTAAPGNESLISRIASVVLKSVSAPPADAPEGASYGIVAEHVKSLRVGNDAHSLVSGEGNDGPDEIEEDTKVQILEI